jgi:hypothetical protein
MKAPPRTIRAINALTLSMAFVVSACSASGPSPSVSPTPIETPTPAPSEPPASEAPNETPSPSVAPQPTDEPDAGGGFAWADQLRILVDGLAVRRDPHSSSPLTLAMVWDADAQAWTNTQDEVRLNAGHLVTVSLGPILEDGIAWYRVFSYPQSNQTPEQEVRWDWNHDGLSDEGWIAVSQDGQAYAERRDVEPDPHQIPLPLVFASGGSGTFEFEPFQASHQLAGDVALLVSGGVAPCDLEITLEPTGETFFSTSLQGLVTVEKMATDATQTLPEGEYSITVTAGVAGNPDASCHWAISLFQAQG